MSLKFNKIHFPTALGLLILLIAIVVGVILVKSRPGVTTEAQATVTPKQVRITNVSDNSFSVSFITDKATSGTVKYGTQISELSQSALDDRDQLSGDAGAFEAHHISLKNLTPSTKYYFKIVSGGKEYDNQGKAFEATTGPSLGSPPAADPVYGTILTASKTPAEGTIVYVNLANGAPLSALAKTNGNWALSLSTARTADLNSFLTYDTQATIVNILVQGGSLGTAPAITTTSNDSPVPDITLGQSHDFRTMASDNQNLTESDDMLDQDINTEEEDADNGFNIDPMASDSGEIAETGEVTLENPSFNGEIINATQPAFVGSGPPGTVLSLTINSETNLTGSATIDDDGEWEFTPPEGLEPGEHKVTVAYIDSQGVEQTIIRNFVVAAAGESETPAIVATPSGSMESSPVPSSTESARTQMPSTESGVPEPGTFEVTLIMLLTGLGLLISGIVLKNKV